MLLNKIQTNFICTIMSILFTETTKHKKLKIYLVISFDTIGFRIKFLAQKGELQLWQ